MGRIVELVVFSMLALIVHVAGFYSIPAKGMQAGGVGGENPVSIIAANQQFETMVDAWDQSPVVESVSDQLAKSSTTEQAPVLSVPSSSVAIVNIPSMETPNVSEPEQPITLDISSAKQPAKSETQKTPDPKQPEKPKGVVKEKPAVSEEVIVKKPTKDEIKPPLRRPLRKSPPKKDIQKTRINQKSSAGSDGQLSAGKGKSSFAGKGKANVTTGASAKQLTSIKAVWGARNRRRIERVRKYPRGVRKNGRAVVILVVSRSGDLMNYRLGHSSGNSKLDAAALQAVNKSGRLPAAPKELKGKSYKFSVPIVFKR